MIIYHDTNAAVLGMTLSKPHTTCSQRNFWRRGEGGVGKEGGEGGYSVFLLEQAPTNTPMQSFSSDADQEECQKMETALSCVKVRNAPGC